MQLAIDDNIVMTKVDIKEYYMSGEHRMLIQEVMPYTDSSIRSVLHECLWILLAHQYVQGGQLVFRVL